MQEDSLQNHPIDVTPNLSKVAPGKAEKEDEDSIVQLKINVDQASPMKLSEERQIHKRKADIDLLRGK